MIVGIGVDIVPVKRIRESLERTPRLVERLFAVSERGLPPRSLAGRFAAKEALIKALGGHFGLAWHEIELSSASSGAPEFCRSEVLAQALHERAIDRLHVSLTHDGGLAVAVVVAERDAS